MWRGLYTAATGMITETKRTDTIANNLANANTTGFKRDDAVLTRHEVKICTAQITSQILIFSLRIKDNYRLSSFTEIRQQQLHKITFSLTGIAQNQDV